uniref:Ig-like domain-containing protein n=1 Tax=Neogobius melanostomus TaxID=47308 RepID=A0A8C6TFF8_9GOBI
KINNESKLSLLYLSYALMKNRKEAVTINTPSPMEALSGSCLNIPCTYTRINIDPEISFKGIWYKTKSGAANVISVSGDSSKSYPMNITGNLKNRDCTTMFHDLTQRYEDKYFFRIENGPNNKATAICTNLQITVRDSPWSPSLEVSGNQTETEEVTITCSAVTPCPHAPPQLTWDLHQGTANRLEANSDGTFTTKITRKIPLATSHDQFQITCTAAYRLNGRVESANSTMTLNLTYGPKDTSVRVSPSGTLSAGQSVTLSCSSRAKPPVQNFTWFRHSSQGPVSVSKGDTFSFNFSQNIHEQYYCEAKNRAGKQASSVIHVGPGGNTSWLKGKYITTTEDKLIYSNWPTASNTLHKKNGSNTVHWTNIF